MIGEVLFKRLLLSDGQIALALTVVLQTEEREPLGNKRGSLLKVN